ncbi:hypothetical protein GRAN_0484 [Granulicella sibirica]|uniref:Uncharacterized protein n=1 Tax=Granulicella sibirica TaxID=2479048 RepID=A0A4V1L5W4_9BACT|nr:hypothetical protein GRAN_0484 [Granulicella sibirica]
MGLAPAETTPAGCFFTLQLPRVEFGDKVIRKMHLAQALGMTESLGVFLQQ